MKIEYARRYKPLTTTWILRWTGGLDDQISSCVLLACCDSIFYRYLVFMDCTLAFV